METTIVEYGIYLLRLSREYWNTVYWDYVGVILPSCRRRTSKSRFLPSLFRLRGLGFRVLTHILST